MAADFFPHGQVGRGLPAAGVGEFSEGVEAGDFGRASGEEGNAGLMAEGGEFGEQSDVSGGLFEEIIADDECEGLDAGDFGLFDEHLEDAGLREGGLCVEVGVEFVLGDIEEADFQVGVGVEAAGEKFDAAPGGFDGLEGGVPEDGAESGGEGVLDELDHAGLVGVGVGDFVAGDEVGDEGVDVGGFGIFGRDGLAHEAFEVGAGFGAFWGGFPGGLGFLFAGHFANGGGGGFEGLGVL